MTWTSRLLSAMVIAPAMLGAQGTLSTQGLGYPQGQMSTAVISMGGAVAENDPLSPLNPAALIVYKRPVLSFQVEPEYRTMVVNGRELRTSLARFPLFTGSIPMGSKWAVGIAASTLLDHTWETVTRDTQFLNNKIDTVAATLGQRSEGSIADVRLAFAYSPTAWFRIGVGGHAFSGRSQMRIARTFDDVTRFASDTELTTLSFGGNAVSVGMQLVSKIAGLGVSYRRGGALREYLGDSVVTSGQAPDHLGLSLMYLGISGTTLGVRVAHDNWAKLSGLARGANVASTYDVGVGGDATGPHFGGSPIGLRAGVRWRTLPFAPLLAGAVKERTVSGGIGLPMAGGAVELNLGVLRATRTSGNITENAWTFSTSFSVAVRQ